MLQKFTSILIYSCLVLLSLTGCSDPRVHTPEVTAVWGRGQQIGQTLRTVPSGLAVTPDGEQVFTVWGERIAEDAPLTLHFIAFDKQGDKRVETTLALTPNSLRQLTLYWDDNGRRLHLIWRDSQATQGALWHTQLSTSGEIITEPTPISPPEHALAWSKGVLLESGDLIFMWQEENGDLYGQQLRQVGQAQPTLLKEETVGADFQIDDQNHLHLATTTRNAQHELDFSYTMLDPLLLTEIVPPTPLLSLPLGQGTSNRIVRGPILALDQGHLYVSWTRRLTTLAGTLQRLYYVALPITSEGTQIPPDLTADQFISIPSLFPPVNNVPAEGYFNYQELSQAGSSLFGTASASRAPVTLNLQASETILAAPLNYSTRTREARQPTMIYFQDGQLKGYQLVTWTDLPSANLVLTADEQGQLYLLWTDVTNDVTGSPLYLATTAVTFRGAWDQLNGQDYLVISSEIANRLALGVSFVPLVASWVMIPFIWIFIVMLVSSGGLYGPKGHRPLLTALFIYWAFKHIGTPQILTYIPALYVFPPTIAPLLIYLIPLLTLLISTSLAGIFYFRPARGDMTLVPAYLLIVGIDFALSLTVYSLGYFS